MTAPLSVGLLAQTACLWEVSARKLGDVNPGHDFDTLRYADFVLSAAAFAPIVESGLNRPLGETVREAVRAMRRAVAGNPHLGTILLLVPLAASVERKEPRPLASGPTASLRSRLLQTDVADARAVYEAIRIAEPSGLGSASEQDVANEPTRSLREVMCLATDRDLIARQYTNGFADILDLGVPALKHGIERFGCLEGAILFCQLVWLANHPDSLIARKHGPAEAAEASRQAREVLDQRWPDTEAAWKAWHQLDHWMRSKRGRNPGTTADLVGACLFVALRTGILTVPLSLPWTTPGWNEWLNRSKSA